MTDRYVVFSFDQKVEDFVVLAITDKAAADGMVAEIRSRPNGCGAAILRSSVDRFNESVVIAFEAAHAE